MARLGRRYPAKPHLNTYNLGKFVDNTAVNFGDTYIRQDVPNDNQGSNTGLSVQWYQPFLATNHNLFQFRLPPTDKGPISEIRLYLWSNGGGSGGADCDLYTCNTFTESTVTWNLAPAIGTNVDSINNSSPTPVGWRYWVIRGPGATNSQNSLTWGMTAAFRLRFTTESGATKNFGWNSKENADVNTRPFISVIYTPTKVVNSRTKLTNFSPKRASRY